MGSMGSSVSMLYNHHPRLSAWARVRVVQHRQACKWVAGRRGEVCKLWG